jgi:hypothetical protein
MNTHVNLTLMITSKKLSGLNLNIHEASHQKRLAVDGMSSPTETIISCKYNTHVKSRI